MNKLKLLLPSHGKTGGRMRHTAALVAAAVLQLVLFRVQPGHALRPAEPPPNLLLWLPVHDSEPDDHVRAAVDCLFRRWTPSLARQNFDVLVTLAAWQGTAAVADGLASRAASVRSIVADGVAHLGPPPPHVTALPLLLTTDAYDVDEARGRASSFAGPNELFYRAMGGVGVGGRRRQ